MLNGMKGMTGFLKCRVAKLGLRREVRKTATAGKPVRIVVGAATTHQPGWIPTEEYSLNLLVKEDWEYVFDGAAAIDAIVAEHVWEHLTEQDGVLGFRNCFDYLRPGGYLRIAVPDGFHPDDSYIDYVKPGGHGAGADDHKVLYDFETLGASLESAGFTCRMLEYWDRTGGFHSVDWPEESGLIRRSRRFDPRNTDGELRFTSLIIDGIKPGH